MKRRVADIIMDELADLGIRRAFAVVGGNRRKDGSKGNRKKSHGSYRLKSGYRHTRKPDDLLLYV